MSKHIHKECLEIAESIGNKMLTLHKYLEDNPDKNISMEAFQDFRVAYSTINKCVQQINS